METNLDLNVAGACENQFYLQVKCDQIYQKGFYTCIVSKHTFHPHLLATSMHQQNMCLLLL